MHWALLVTVVLWGSVAVAWGQDAAPACADVLRQTQAQLSLTQSMRGQGEFVAADAIAALRKRIETLESENAALQKEANTPVPAPDKPASGRQ